MKRFRSKFLARISELSLDKDQTCAASRLQAEIDGDRAAGQ